MRQCKGQYTEYNQEKHRFENIPFEEGLFHQWGNDYQEYEEGPGNFTVGIVELPDGRVVTPIARFIQFVS